MSLRLHGFLKIGMLAAVLLGVAWTVLPGRAGAQTPLGGNLIAVSGGTSVNGLVSLTGYNGVAVTVNAATPGASYNVFSCTANVSTPDQGCQLDGAIYVNSGGQASTTLTSPITANATTEVFVQNANNANELYVAVFSGSYAGVTSSCSAGSVVYYIGGAVSNCASTTSSGVACNFFYYGTSTPVCVSLVGNSLPFWYGALGINVINPTGIPTTCVVGGGLQPVLVGNTVIYQFC